MDISIVVPFYKGNQYMRQLFEIVSRNAANARELDIELLLVNDSPDTPVSYEEAWVRGFTLRILRNPQNMGIHRSRINGIRSAAGKFVQLLDQDDLLADNAIASQFAAIGQSDIVVCNGNEQMDGRPGILYRSIRQQRLVMVPRYYYTVRCLITSPGQCLIRKSAIPELWLDTPIQTNGADDWFLWLLMLRTCHWTVNPDRLFTHVSTGSNLSLNSARMKASCLEVKDIMKSHGLLTPKQERQFLRRLQMRQRCAGKPPISKLLIMACYPDLLWDLARLKLQ